MKDLDSDARDIVDTARDADDPSPADRSRIKHALLAQVAMVGVASTAAAGTTALATKVVVAALAVSLLGGGSAAYLHWQGKQRTSHAATTTPSPTPAAQPVIPFPVEPPAATTPPPPPEGTATPTEGKARRPDRPRKTMGQASEEPAMQEDQLNAEVAVLSHAREELRLGRPAQALEALREYDRRFASGALHEERQAIAAIAACQAHPGPSAQAQAQAFIRSSPKSPLLDRVRAACITPAR
jgi:hypothetical protein